jgi:zinc transport system ATP-binding protein
VTPDGSDPPLTDVDAVTIRIHGNTILDRVSLRVACGTAHVVVGPNGAGKSTLLKAILGQVAFDGRIVMHWRGNGSIGYVPQSFPVDPTLPVNVYDFLALTRTRRPVSLGLGRSTRERIDMLLARVGMQGKGRRPLAVLSGGELRRVLLAHALDPDPELLILDEPTSGLDADSAGWLDDTLLALRHGRRTTILMVSHDHDRVRRIADTVTVIDGRVVAEGPPDTILDASDHVRVAR